MMRIIPFSLAFICVIMVVLEGTISLNVLHMIDYLESKSITPHFLFLFLVYITVFFDRSHTYYGLAFAVLFGFTIDLIYTDILGIYLFVYASVIYVVREIMKLLHANFLVVMLISIMGILATDILAYFLYNIIQVHDQIWQVYWKNRLIPTFIWNILFSPLFYLFFNKRLKKWSAIMFDRKG
ncbi:rod shape-determining protein MreD [Gracilibacillus sp. YIM 98692]|uniref:rod shape-determining protein MreD n=1 Tax=Gracilibacillus sp. YIM 98692 TaxID=2663532 RepID=UPI0013D87E44|nr:rod shape-determining protein MreD [Gracilibacillus sp. YIM 98692]